MIIPPTTILDRRHRHNFRDLGHGVSRELWLNVSGIWESALDYLGGCCCRWFEGREGGLLLGYW